jgi:hypothetical protein
MDLGAGRLTTRERREQRQRDGNRRQADGDEDGSD